MSIYTLDFERPLREIEEKIDAMKSTGINTGMDVSEAIKKLEYQLSQEKLKIYGNLNRWERVQLARHPKRPYSSDYIAELLIIGSNCMVIDILLMIRQCYVELPQLMI